MPDRYNASGKGLREIEMHNKDADFINSNIVSFYDLYFAHKNYLMNIATNMHTFYGLPLNPEYNRPVRSSFFEQILIYNGNGCIARTEQFGLIVSPCTVVDNYNIYGEPVKLKLTPSRIDWSNFYGQGLDIELNTGEFAYFRNDNLCSSLIPLVENTTKMLTTCLYGIDKNVGQQKFPNIMKGTKDTKLTMQHIIAQIDGYVPFILIKDDSGFDLSQTQLFNANMPYVADKMYQTYTDILNNFFMRLGINIIPNAKKERMLTDEVNANNQAIRSVSDVYLNNRIEGCEIARSIFPELTDLRVERNNEFVESLKNMSTEDHISNVFQGGEL